MKSDSLPGRRGEIRTTRRLPEHFPKGIVVMNVVYVLAPDRTPLMPCSAVIARLLLTRGKAKVVRRTPFTIKLHTQPETTYTQPLTLGVDTGSSVIGSAVADEHGKVLYLSEVAIRNDIATTSDRASQTSSRSSQSQNEISPRSLVKSKKLHQNGKILAHHDEQNRGAPARNPLCASIVTDHVGGAGNGDL
jgi:hypothetical protein